ncbi:hypothetical protein CY35_04G028000 [Sphagnum magellanicum]|nr:hypothetical protein CY35_04G028000 [Sphagnum magellanicum]
MNRRSTENLVEDLFDDFVYEVQVPYILYRNATQEVNGIWFYNPRECEEVAKLFQRLFGTPLSFQSRILSTFSNKSQKTNLLPSRSEYQELEPMNVGRINTPDVTPTIIPQPSATIHTLPNRTTLVASTNVPMPIPPSTTSLPHTSLTPLSMDTANVSNPMRTTLIPPAFFIPPPRSSASTTPPLPTSTSQLQSAPHGAPLLQPFPPPNPPPSLATPMLHNGPITREGVHEALNRLLKNDHFIDMVYREMVNAHST